MMRRFRAIVSSGCRAKGIVLSLAVHAALVGAGLYLSAPAKLAATEEQSIAVEIILEDVSVAAVESPEDNAEMPADRPPENAAIAAPTQPERDRPDPAPPRIAQPEMKMPDLPEPAMLPDQIAILTALRSEEQIHAVEVRPLAKPGVARKKPTPAIQKILARTLAANTIKTKGLAVSDPSRASRQTGKSGKGRVQTASEDDALSSYRAMLNARIRSSQKSLRADARGKVIVSFTLNRAGRILSKRLRKSSGTASLDGAVIAMLDRIGSFPPFPPEIRSDSLPVSVPIVFE
ncbi:energy transducer TonB [soil metagenome]